MEEIDKVYRELHHLVRHGQKQGFVAGVIFTGVVVLGHKINEDRRIAAAARQIHRNAQQ